MSDVTVSLSETAHETLVKLAETSGETIQTVLDRAIENYRRYVFLMQANRAFADLRKNEALWQEELEEREVWDQSLSDGMSE